MKIAVATSLTTIVFTSLASASSHYKRGAVDWSWMGLVRQPPGGIRTLVFRAMMGPEPRNKGRQSPNQVIVLPFR